MSFVVVIPARYASTRLPGKPLLDIVGKSLIERVSIQASLSSASRVVVATDDQRIADHLAGLAIDVCMTRADHISGSDRIAEVIEQLQLSDETVLVNVQGDEPMIPPRLIDEVAQSLINAPDAVMSTAAHQITETADITNPNVVKVVFNQMGKALYFSRSTIPYDRDQKGTAYWKHIGIYAYKAGFLKRYHLLPPSDMEQAESLEQLRVLDNGEDIMVQTVDYDVGIGVDTQEDLAKVRTLLEQQGQTL